MVGDVTMKRTILFWLLISLLVPAPSFALTNKIIFTTTGGYQDSTYTNFNIIIPTIFRVKYIRDFKEFFLGLDQPAEGNNYKTLLNNWNSGDDDDIPRTGANRKEVIANIICDQDDRHNFSAALAPLMSTHHLLSGMTVTADSADVRYDQIEYKTELCPEQ